MLSVNKPLMDTQFSLLTMPQTGAVYKAAYNAYYNLASAAAQEAMGSSDDPDLAPILAQAQAEMKAKLVEDANKFATDFCEGISDMLKEISNQIDAHVKAVANGLIITMMPQGIATIVAPPAGPCTGTMVIKNGTTAAVQIM